MVHLCNLYFYSLSDHQIVVKTEKRMVVFEFCCWRVGRTKEESSKRNHYLLSWMHINLFADKSCLFCCPQRWWVIEVINQWLEISWNHYFFSSEAVAIDVANRTLPEWLGWLIPICVALSCIGGVNGSIIVSSR